MLFVQDPEIITLRRGSCTLHGSGAIGLGAPPTDALNPSVHFEVIKFADTSPQGLPRVT